MDFKFLSKNLITKKEQTKKYYEKNAQLLMNREFERLVDKQLNLPVILLDL